MKIAIIGAGNVGGTLGKMWASEGPRLLEPLAVRWISMAYAYGAGPNIGFALLRK